MLKNKITIPLLALSMFILGGAAAGATAIASAQTATNTPANMMTGTNTQSGMPMQHHMPLGNDGIVASVNGTTIVMNEEADEGGAAYTVDASKATVNINGSTGSISDIKAGEKIFVHGTVSGTSVTATTISVGHPGGHGGWMGMGMHGPRPNDNDADDGVQTGTSQSSTTNQ